LSAKEQHKQNNPPGRKADRAVDASETVDRVGDMLRRAYRDAAEEPIPPHMIELIRRIERNDGGDDSK